VKTSVVIVIATITICILVVAFYLSTLPPSNHSSTPTPTNIEEVTVEKVSLQLWGGIDSVSVCLTLENSADYKNIHYEVIVEGKGQRLEGDHLLWLGSSTFSVTERLIRNPGEYDFDLTVRITDKNGEVLATKECTASLLTMKVGDTVPEVESFHNLSLTITSWIESKIAVYGPYTTGYYTFTAKPGMKFIILFFSFQNNWIREQTTPYVNSGELFTEVGYIYERWSPPGAHSEEYDSRRSTEEEVRELVGDAGAYERLLQEESVEGCVIFEIPQDAEPIEASLDSTLVHFPNIVVFS